SISKANENSVLQCLNSGDSYQKIAKTLGLGLAMVQQIANRLYPGHVVAKMGCPSKLTEQDRLYCIWKIMTGGKEMAVDVARSLEEELGVPVHVNTVHNTLYTKGMNTIAKPKKLHLSPKDVRSYLD
ncbi:hypothetical protein LPJ72_005902, partial [Coemansia sp. Benny D160-2]